MAFQISDIFDDSKFNQVIFEKSTSKIVNRSHLLFSIGFTTDKPFDRYSAMMNLVPCTNCELYRKSIKRRIKSYEANPRTSFFRHSEFKNCVTSGTIRQSITGKIIQDLEKEKLRHINLTELKDNKYIISNIKKKKTEISYEHTFF